MTLSSAIRSVRFRLTVTIVVLTAVLTSVAALVGLNRFEATVVGRAIDGRLAQFEGIEDREGLTTSTGTAVDLLLLEELGVLEGLESSLEGGQFDDLDDLSELDGDDLDQLRQETSLALADDARRSLLDLADVGLADLIFGELTDDDGLVRVLLFDLTVAAIDAGYTLVSVSELEDVTPGSILVLQDDLFELEALAQSQFEIDFEDDVEDDDDDDDEDELAEELTILPVVAPFDDLSVGFVIDLTDELAAVDSVRLPLWLAAAALVALAGTATWLLTGRALGPVAAITSRVDEISAGNLDGRVPEPATADEIGMLARTMNRMLARLESSDRRRRQFVSDASHELRTPVAVLRSEAEVAIRVPDGTSVPDLAGVVLTESARLERLVEDLLALTTLDERRGATAGNGGDDEAASGFVEFDVDDVVLAEAARARRLPVDRRSVSAGRVVGVPSDLGRTIGHLLDNAARHGEAQLAVGVRTEGGPAEAGVDTVVRVWVDDDGSGVDVVDRQRIFERFVRLDEARSRDGGGAGLGLAVVAETVAAMGGEVVVEESPLGGARFELRLPAV